MRSLTRPLLPVVTGTLLPSLVLATNERQRLRNVSRRSSGNGCACLLCVRSYLVFTVAPQLADKVKKLAGKTHKDRVNDFNTKLEALSEHHDIPKVNTTSNFSAPHLISSPIRLVLDKVGVEHSGVPPHSSFLLLCSGLSSVGRFCRMFESLRCSVMSRIPPCASETSSVRDWCGLWTVVVNTSRVPEVLF